MKEEDHRHQRWQCTKKKKYRSIEFSGQQNSRTYPFELDRNWTHVKRTWADKIEHPNPSWTFDSGGLWWKKTKIIKNLLEKRPKICQCKIEKSKNKVDWIMGFTAQWFPVRNLCAQSVRTFLILVILTKKVIRLLNLSPELDILPIWYRKQVYIMIGFVPWDYKWPENRRVRLETDCFILLNAVFLFILPGSWKNFCWNHFRCWFLVPALNLKRIKLV